MKETLMLFLNKINKTSYVQYTDTSCAAWEITFDLCGNGWDNSQYVPVHQ